mgnify:CR=1 FL=1
MNSNKNNILDTGFLCMQSKNDLYLRAHVVIEEPQQWPCLSRDAVACDKQDEEANHK